MAYGYAVPILFSHFSTADPKNTSPGSARTALALSGTETQHVPLRQLLILPYVVFPLRSVTRRAAAENSASLIP